MISEKCNFIVFIHISLIINKDAHYFICFLAVYSPPTPVGYLFMSFAYFLYWSVCLSLKIYKCSSVSQLSLVRVSYMVQTCHN